MNNRNHTVPVPLAVFLCLLLASCSGGDVPEPGVPSPGSRESGSAGPGALDTTLQSRQEAGPGSDRTHIAFVIAEDEYDAHLTLPAFAERHLSAGGRYAFNVIQTDEDGIDGMEQIRDADMVVLYVRRRHPTEEQLDRLRGHLDAGKPLIALRTSSHAFETWPGFDAEVLGGNYTGHHGNRPPADPATYVQVISDAGAHPVIAGLPDEPFQVASWLYRTRPLADDAVPLMKGRVGDSGEYEPVAWVRKYGGARIFYTSLGHPRDFDIPAFNRMLVNAIQWAGKEDGPAHNP